MNEFVLHPQAYADIDELWEYIAADNLDAVDRTGKKSTKRSSRSYRFLT